MMNRIAAFFMGFLMVATLSQVQAQHYIGIRGGYGSGSVRFFPEQKTNMIWGLYSGGLSYKFFSNVKYVGAIQIDLQLMQKGFSVDRIDDRTPDDTTMTYSRTVNSIDLPIMWQPHFYLMNRTVRVFINLGLNFSYNLDSRYKWESPWQGVVEAHKYEMQSPRDNRWGYGLCGGAGIGVLIRRFEVTIEGRYYYGYSDILRNRTKYAPNPLRSPLDNINVSMGLYYRLNKEGLRSVPSQRMAEKMRQKELDNIIENSTSKVPTEELKIKEDQKNGNDKTTESSKTDTKGH